MPRKTYVKMTHEQKSENMRISKFNKKLEDPRYIELVAEIFQIQKLLSRCLTDNDALGISQRLHPSREYTFNAQFKRLSFSQSLTQIREKYGAFGVDLWKCFFTYIQRGGYSQEEMHGYPSYWCLTLERMNEFDNEVERAMIGLNLSDPPFNVQVKVIMAMVQFSRQFTSFHYSLTKSLNPEILVLGNDFSKQLVDPIQKAFYKKVCQEMKTFVLENQDLAEEAKATKSVQKLEKAYLSQIRSLRNVAMPTII